MRKVNLFLLGAPRSGTTNMFDLISSNQDVGPLPIKEPNHFSSLDFPDGLIARDRLNDVEPDQLVSFVNSGRTTQFAVVRERQQYHFLAGSQKARWVLDASTSYLASAVAIESIMEYNPESHIIVLIRNPLERAISHYGLATRIGRVRGSLMDEIERELTGEMPLGGRYLIRPSMYSGSIELIHTLVPTENLKIIFFEDFVVQQQKLLAEIVEWLDLPRMPESISHLRRNQTSIPRMPRLNEFLLRTGVKTYLRRTASTGIKQVGKRILFREGKPHITETERHRLSEILEPDARKTLALLDRQSVIWNLS